MIQIGSTAAHLSNIYILRGLLVDRDRDLEAKRQIEILLEQEYWQLSQYGC